LLPILVLVGVAPSRKGIVFLVGASLSVFLP
jgi:hypothetical protein